MLQDLLRERLEPIFAEFSTRISQATSLTVRTDFSFNDSFLLRGQIDTARDDDSEVAITADVRIDEGILSIECAICRDDGYIYKRGPSLRLAVGDEQDVASAFDPWLVEMKEYLAANEAYYIGLLR